MALPASQPVPVVKPLPRFPVRQPDGLAALGGAGTAASASRAREARPHDLLLLDIKDLVGGTGAVPPQAQLYCLARLEGAGAPAPAAAQGGAAAVLLVSHSSLHPRELHFASGQGIPTLSCDSGVILVWQPLGRADEQGRRVGRPRLRQSAC